MTSILRQSGKTWKSFVCVVLGLFGSHFGISRPQKTLKCDRRLVSRFFEAVGAIGAKRQYPFEALFLELLMDDFFQFSRDEKLNA
jgi:hypothetical protein